jgi:hypothetical protein
VRRLIPVALLILSLPGCSYMEAMAETETARVRATLLAEMDCAGLVAWIESATDADSAYAASIEYEAKGC